MNSLKEQASAKLEITPGAPLWRRFLAILYDALMVFCVVFVVWYPMLHLPSENWPDWLYQGVRLFYLFLITFGFFGWFWTHGGQTIGMRAWKIRLVDHASLHTKVVNPTWSQALTHYIVALLSWAACGLGFFLALFNQDKRTWHDRAADTSMVVQRKIRVE